MLRDGVREGDRVGAMAARVRDCFRDGLVEARPIVESIRSASLRSPGEPVDRLSKARGGRVWLIALARVDWARTEAAARAQ